LLRPLAILVLTTQKRVNPYYRKWLRYYLDFCQKYGFIQSDTKSLPHFIKKLKEKKQTDLQQKQAADAIYIYYGEETIREDKNVLSKTNNKIISSKKDNLKPTNASWVPEYKDFRDAPKIIRFYSYISKYPFSDAIRSPRCALILTAGCEILSFGARSAIVNPNSLTAQ